MLFAWASSLPACGSSNPPEPAQIDIASPAASSSVSGAVLVTATVTGGDAATLTYYADVVDAAHVLGDAPAGTQGDYAFTWFSAELANGLHELIAEATIDGDSVQGSVTVDVGNLGRADGIPSGAVKQTPATDQHPPVLEPAFTAVFDDCAPLAGPVNTAGAEDSPYITADGQELYLFFTPDAGVPANEQLVDGLTGIYRSVRDGSGWSEPARVYLNYDGDPALDGCETVFGDEMWFCTARAGVQRSIDIYVAHRDGDHWVDWASAGTRVNIDLEMGELHIADGGDSIYYHSQRAGGQGGIDIWLTQRANGDWGDPVDLTAVNTPYTDGWPWVSPDGQELWFTSGAGAPEVWRSLKSNGVWQAPEKVVGPFAGEPTFDADGNLYFTHHFWDDATNSIIEADIYECKRK